MSRIGKNEFLSAPHAELLEMFKEKKVLEVENGDQLFVMDYGTGLFFGQRDVKIMVFRHLVKRKDYTDPEGEFRYVTMDRKMMDPRDVGKTLSEFYRYVKVISEGGRPKIKTLAKEELSRL